MYNRIFILTLVFSGICQFQSLSQCLSSVNPVGGTENLLVLQKKSLRIISFYKYAEGKQYFEKDHHSDFDLISRSYYNYLSGIIGYGLTNRWTVETEFGYFINKSQVYNTKPVYHLKGSGLSSAVVSAKYNIYAEQFKRIYFSTAIGVRMPFSRIPQKVDNVELPVDVQPSIGAYGIVLNSSFVKENTGKGLRFFITNRVETMFPNKQDFQLGTSVFTSFFISKHLMFGWMKGDWTAILQLRNETRTHDKISGQFNESSGGTLFFVVPQVNYVIAENWYLSALVDLPVYQYFNGVQMGAGIGVTFTLSRAFNLASSGDRDL